MSMNGKAAGGTLLLEGSFSAGATAGTIAQADIKWNAKQAAAKLVQLPISETWQITDLYVTSATNATSNDPVVEFYKDTERLLDISKPLGTVIVSSAQRPNGLNADLRYEGGSQLSAQFVSLVTNAAASTPKAQASYEKS